MVVDPSGSFVMDPNNFISGNIDSNDGLVVRDFGNDYFFSTRLVYGRLVNILGPTEATPPGTMSLDFSDYTGIRLNFAPSLSLNLNCSIILHSKHSTGTFAVLLSQGIRPGQATVDFPFSSFQAPQNLMLNKISIITVLMDVSAAFTGQIALKSIELY